MIVCSCNAIREAEIRAAARRGARCADSAYQAMGCEFQCGGCRDYAEELVEEEQGPHVRLVSNAA